jgi:plasmid stabilization system protein ParE
VIRYSPRGAAHIVGLLEYYDRLERPEAMRNFLVAVRAASDMIEDDPAAGLPSPRPYPWLVRSGVSWVKSSVYWIGYRRKPELVIVAVFHERADIPARF